LSDIEIWYDGKITEKQKYHSTLKKYGFPIWCNWAKIMSIWILAVNELARNDSDGCHDSGGLSGGFRLPAGTDDVERPY
jgi:hypothetical protein